MPGYTIKSDAPWMAQPRASTFSVDQDHMMTDAAHVSSETREPSTLDTSFHAHPNQQIMDKSQNRQSRLPIFQQVRSMLHKPPNLITPGQPKWDEHSGELSETGRAAQVKPSAYVSPFEGAFKARRRSPERTANRLRKAMSAISILRDDEIKPTPPLKAGRNSPSSRVVSPVSAVPPVSPVSSIYDSVSVPAPLSITSRNDGNIPTATPTSSKQIKRKPVSSSPSENVEPQRSPSARSDWTDVPEDEDPVRSSHFSWTTYAPSVATGRQSNATIPAPAGASESRFSWSTVATNTTRHTRFESQASSPPPPIPPKYAAMPQYQTPRGAPMQSILSRQRPIQRLDRDEWTPPPRKPSADSSRLLTPGTTPIRAGSPLSATSSGKKLPLPPQASQLSHLDSLLAQEQDLLHQRKNVEKGIADLTKITKASPMDVSYAAVKNAEKALEDYRTRLAEVGLEEREVGIAISRARRKKEGGSEEGLWVRRCTG